jgi:hypothetical protein
MYKIYGLSHIFLCHHQGQGLFNTTRTNPSLLFHHPAGVQVDQPLHQRHSEVASCSEAGAVEFVEQDSCK